MKFKAVSGMMLTLLSIGILISTFKIQPVMASGTIYIRADGSIEGTTDISTVDNVTYTFTSNIYDEVRVERSNIIIDGAGYTLQGPLTGRGFDLTGVSNVTIQNTNIDGWFRGVLLLFSSNNTISGNNITNNWAHGVLIQNSSHNTVSGNNITKTMVFAVSHIGSDFNTISGNNILNNYGAGVVFSDSCTNNNVSGNNITNNWAYVIAISGSGGAGPGLSCNNTVSGNNITNNGHEKGYPAVELIFGANNNIVSENDIRNNLIGLHLNEASNNQIYHNNIINNTQQVEIVTSDYNFWDEGYPSGGNYWSDQYHGDCADHYKGPGQNISGSDDIVDDPYVIDANNTDRYPLMEPWAPTHDVAVTNVAPRKTVVGQGCPVSINVTVQNQGSYPEIFNVTAYANTTQVGKKTVTTLNPGASKVVSFTWDTVGFAIGNYTMSAVADVVTNETDTADNTCIDGIVTVRSPIHDVAVVDVLPASNVVVRGSALNISVTVENQGDYPETFNATVYFDATPINTTEVTLTCGNSTSVTFTWNTTGIDKGDYTMSAVADVVTNETDTPDNTKVDDTVTVVVPEHDVAIKDITPSKTVVGQGYSLSIYVTAKNYGNFTDTFNVTVYYNETNPIATKNVTLTRGNSTTVTVTWNTMGVPYGDCIISANATQVPSETELDDNTFEDGWVKVTKVGDVNGDGKVTGADIVNVLINLGPVPPKPPECDVDGDGVISGADIVLVLINLG